MGIYYTYKEGSELEKYIEELQEEINQQNKTRRYLKERLNKYLNIKTDLNYIIGKKIKGEIDVSILVEDYYLLSKENQEKFIPDKYNKYKVKNMKDFKEYELISEYVDKSKDVLRRLTKWYRKYELRGKYVYYNKRHYFFTNDVLKGQLEEIREKQYKNDLEQEIKDNIEKYNDIIARIYYVLHVKEIKEEDYKRLERRLYIVKKRRDFEYILDLNDNGLFIEGRQEDIRRYKNEKELKEMK